MRTELQDLQQSLGTTTIYVTHDQTEAMTMGDRIAILNEGQLQQVGPPLECYHQPNNRFVASFIGSPSMNFLEVEHEAGMLSHPSFTYSVSSGIEEQLADAPRSLILGIRPEDIGLAEPSETNAISITVSVVEPMGDQTHLYFDIGNSQMTATIDGTRPARSGDDISIEFPEDRIHLFDAQTGEAIMNSDIQIDSTESAPASTPA